MEKKRKGVPYKPKINSQPLNPWGGGGGQVLVHLSKPYARDFLVHIAYVHQMLF